MRPKTSAARYIEGAVGAEKEFSISSRDCSNIGIDNGLQT